MQRRNATVGPVPGARRCRMRGVGESRRGPESNFCHACGSSRETSNCMKWWRLDGVRFHHQSPSVGGWPRLAHHRSTGASKRPERRRRHQPRRDRERGRHRPPGRGLGRRTAEPDAAQKFLIVADSAGPNGHMKINDELRCIQQSPTAQDSSSPQSPASRSTNAERRTDDRYGVLRFLGFVNPEVRPASLHEASSTGLRASRWSSRRDTRRPGA